MILKINLVFVKCDNNFRIGKKRWSWGLSFWGNKKYDLKLFVVSQLLDFLNLHETSFSTNSSFKLIFVSGICFFPNTLLFCLKQALKPDLLKCTIKKIDIVLNGNNEWDCRGQVESKQRPLTISSEWIIWIWLWVSLKTSSQKLFWRAHVV